MLKTPVLILCVLLCTHQGSCFLDSVLRVAQLVHTVATKITEAKGNIETGKKAYNSQFFVESDPNAEVLGKIAAVSRQIGRLESQLGDRIGAVEAVISELPRRQSIGNDKKDLRGYLTTVDVKYRQLHRHFLQKNEITRDVWKEDAKNPIAIIENNILNMQLLLLAETDSSYFDTGLILNVADRVKNLGSDICKEGQTFDHFATEMIQLVMMAEVKVLAVYSMIYPYLYPRDSDIKLKNALKDMQDRYLLYLKTINYAMKMTPENMRRCDPEGGNWERGRNFYEMERLQQVVYLNKPDTHIISLVSCPELTAETFGWRARELGQFEDCDHGLLTECEDMRGTLRHTQVCRVDGSGLEDKPVIQYSWAATEKIDLNPFTSRQVMTVNGRGYPTGSFSHCRREAKEVACGCICTKDHENAVSLLPTTTNTDANMVVIGARLKRKDKVLYIQLKQGKLLPNGHIDEDKQSWVALPTPSRSQRNWKQPITLASKRFLLANQTLPFGYALVGLQFFKDEWGLINIHLLGRNFNYESGALQNHRITVTLSEDRTDGKRYHGYQQLTFPRRNSILSPESVHELDSKGGRWIELQRSDMESDVGQSMLPLFDGQAIEPNPPSPLGGLGLYHKGVAEYAGFIGLQLNSLPYRKRVKEMLRDYKAGGTLF